MSTYELRDESKDLASPPMPSTAERRRAALAEVDEAKFSVSRAKGLFAFFRLLLLPDPFLTSVVPRQGLSRRWSWFFYRLL